eukprot:395392-Prorocentrum_minimum.AAC.1
MDLDGPQKPREPAGNRPPERRGTGSRTDLGPISDGSRVWAHRRTRGDVARPAGEGVRVEKLLVTVCVEDDVVGKRDADDQVVPNGPH